MSQISLEFRLEGVDPTEPVGNMAVLGDVLRQWSDVIEAVVREQTADGTASQIIVTKVTRGSLRLHSSVPKSYAPAVSLLSESVRTDNLRLLPKAAREPMRKLAQTLRRSRQALRIVKNKQAGVAEALLCDCPAEKSVAPVKGATSLYGRLRSVGGTNPTLKIETDSGVVVVQLDVDQARRIAPALYSEVQLDVEAEWSTDDHQIESCTLLDWRRGPTKSLLEGVRGLSRHHGAAWRDVNISKWLRDMRGNK